MSHSFCISLIKDARKWASRGVADNSSKKRLPPSVTDLSLILVSISITFLPLNEIDADFGGFIISGLSLFAGLLVSLAVSIHDKYNRDKIVKRYNKETDTFAEAKINKATNFYKKSIVLSLYLSLISIVCIILLGLILLFPDLNEHATICQALCPPFSLKVFLQFFFHSALVFFIIDFIYLTIKLIGFFTII